MSTQLVIPVTHTHKHTQVLPNSGKLAVDLEPCVEGLVQTHWEGWWMNNVWPWQGNSCMPHVHNFHFRSILFFDVIYFAVSSLSSGPWDLHGIMWDLSLWGMPLFLPLMTWLLKHFLVQTKNIMSRCLINDSFPVVLFYNRKYMPFYAKTHWIWLMMLPLTWSYWNHTYMSLPIDPI